MAAHPGKRRSSSVRTPLVVQAQASECGVASLAIILAYFGRPVPMAELRRVTGVSRDGIGGPDLIRTGRHYGLESKAYKLEPEAIAARTGFPVIAFLGFMHFAVIEGMDSERVYLNDPGYGRCDMPLEEFREEYTGVVFHFQPGPGVEKSAPAPSTASYLLKNLARQRGLLLAIAATAVTAAATGIATALAPALALSGLHASLLLCLSLAALGCRQHLLNTLQHRLAQSNSAAAVQRVFRLPFAFHIYRVGPFTHGHVMAHERIASTLATTVLPAIAAGATLALLVAAMGWLHPPTAAAVAALLALYALVLRALHERHAADFFRRRVLEQTADNSLQQIAAIEMFRSGGMESEAITGTAARQARYLRYEQRYGEFVSLAVAALPFLQALLFMLVLGVGGTAVRLDMLAPAALTSLLLLAAMCLPALRRLPQLLRDLGDLALTCPPVAEIEDEALETPCEPAAPVPAKSAVLALRAVSFGYALGRSALLKNLSLELRPGVQLGITGPSGCGKSTLAGLLVGLYQPWSGEVDYGGRPLREYTRETLSRCIAWVGRAPLLFEGSVRDNLRLGDVRITDEDLDAAVRDAGLDEVLSQRDGGLDAPVSGRGLNFSGGQRQRMELARALARNPRVVVLDEALEALEPRLEARIREQLRQRGCAVLVVSHRATSLAACDRVMLLKDGALVERIAAVPQRAAAPASAPALTDRESRRLVNRETLIRAFAEVAEATSLRGVRARLSLAPEDAVDVAALAAHAGIAAYRMRFVQARWWQQDHGPLLAFNCSDGQPRVILPGANGNSIADPESRRRTLNASAAKQLQATAYALLPTLAQDVRSPVQMLRAAAGGLRGEGAYVLAAAVVAAGLAVVPALAALLSIAPAVAGKLPLMLVWMALAAVAGLLLDGVRCNALLRAEGKLMLRLAVALWARLLRLPQSWLRALPATDVARRLGAVQRLRDAAGGERLLELCSGLPALGALAMLFVLHLPAALPILAGTFLMGGIPALFALRQRALQQTRDHLATQHRTLLLDALQGIAQLRCCGAEQRLVARWEKTFSQEQTLARRLRNGRSFEDIAADWVPLFAASLALSFGVAGSAPMHAVLVSTILALIALPAAAAFGRGFAALLRGASFASPLFELLAQPLEPVPAQTDITVLRGHIELRNVSFGFVDVTAPVLDRISLSVKPGQIVALVGPSGGGKSTLLRLLLGFEQPAAGEILYDGVSLAQRGHAAVRAQIGAVLQEEQLWPATVRYNIAHHADSDLSQVWAAAQAAGIAQEIQAMPMEMQTLVDEVKMSSGQKQRIFIAAKLLRKPRILLLDEATSVLHEDLQAQLFANLRQLGITCICATHRASAVGQADWVHVIEQGRIVQSGPPSELLAQEGPLKRMQTEQTTGVYQLADGVDLF